MGTRLRNLRNKLKSTKLLDGKKISWRDRLTDVQILLIQKYYGLAIRRNSSKSVEEMSKSIWAIYFRKLSTVLLIARQKSTRAGQKTCFVTLDQPLYIKAQEIAGRHAVLLARSIVRSVQSTRDGTHVGHTGSGTIRKTNRRIMQQALVDPALTRSTIQSVLGVPVVPQINSRRLAEANLQSKRPVRVLPSTPEHQ
ncbi:hypothetical protein AVEN_255796-1 [Araneus ventricosus]|uniref:Transposase Tc1-like domain-containing protein n=1 Tax=Araneus ventricosus TaxID=182803 RepID=A0A4Y2M1D0_ARAVE|nr:hypothetical protein AVEN_255796-1 [Araneus ventricosus]